MIIRMFSNISFIKTYSIATINIKLLLQLLIYKFYNKIILIYSLKE